MTYLNTGTHIGLFQECLLEHSPYPDDNGRLNFAIGVSRHLVTELKNLNNSYVQTICPDGSQQAVDYITPQGTKFLLKLSYPDALRNQLIAKELGKAGWQTIQVALQEVTRRS